MAEKGSSAEQKLKQGAANTAQEAPKPYTTPEGYVPPTMAEQWKYARRRYPQSNYAFPAALICGVVVWALYSPGKSDQKAKSR